MEIIALTPKQLRRAADIQERIEWLQTELAEIFGPIGKPESVPAPAGRPKRKISAAGRARIVAAVRARWARAKAQQAPEAAPAKKTRKISRAGRAAIAAAARARWARAKAAKQAA